MVFPFSYGFPMVFLWFSYGFDHHLRKDLIILWRSPLFLLGDVQLRHVRFPRFDGDFFVGISWDLMSSYLKVYGMTAMGVTITEDLTFTDKNQSWWLMFIDKMLVTSIFTHQAYLVISDCWSVMSWLSWLLQMFSTRFGKQDEKRRDPGTFFPSVNARNGVPVTSSSPALGDLGSRQNGPIISSAYGGCLKIGYPKSHGWSQNPTFFHQKARNFMGIPGHNFMTSPNIVWWDMMRYPMISDYVPVS